MRLLVTDFAACYRFYAEVLGLRPQSGATNGPYEKFSPATGSAGIALQDRAMMAAVLGELGDAAAGHRSLVVLRVDDLDVYCAQLTARGATRAARPGSDDRPHARRPSEGPGGQPGGTSGVAAARLSSMRSA